jgi:hypothetical protein
MVTPAVDASYGEDGRLYITFEDATGLVSGEGGTQGPSDPYPAMVSWEMSAGTMLPDDTRALGLALIRLAEDADRLQAHQDPPAVSRDHCWCPAGRGTNPACPVHP